MTKNIKCPCCGSEDTEYIGYFHYCNDCRCDWREPERKPVSGWISCKEQLPENGQLCLVIFKEEPPPFFYDLAIFSADDGWLSMGMYYSISNMHVDYWQPLPEPPDGKDGE